MGALLLLASCTDDYKDWVAPQTSTPEQAVVFGDGSVSAVDVIKFAEIAEGQDVVKVCNIVAPIVSDQAYTPKFKINLDDKVYDIDIDGNMNLNELVSFVESKFGKAPIQREIDATVNMWVSNGSVAVKTATSETFKIKVVPDAPFIDPNGYYVVGNIDGWSCSRVDAFHMVNNGGDVYANPVFSVTLSSVDGVDPYEVKIIPASAFNDDGSINNWDIALSALPDEDVIANEGKFSYSNAGGNIKFAAVPDAKFYKLSVNLMEGTYKVESGSFAEYIYEIGNSQGWSTSAPLYCANKDGKYQGYYYLDGGYKFKPNKDNWDGDWGQDPNGPEGTLVQDGEKDCNAEAGFYQIDVDLAAMTYKITRVNTISIIGTVNGSWDTDTDMEYNISSGAWEVTTTLSAGAMKFRMNHDWSISWGGSNGDPRAYNNLTQNGGKDLDLDEAGTYFIQLFITYEGNNRVVITKQ